MDTEKTITLENETATVAPEGAEATEPTPEGEGGGRLATPEEALEDAKVEVEADGTENEAPVEPEATPEA
ncbi:MAG: hypothetical protein A2Z42_02945 [Candidatus Woykebacteria bacterium RBG_19FT_COMBO_43_10]|uniref:Uncharacterized protein n=1 Tax=Candidatus Woykebacteria bacterium RBG_19FT_COMBO_43_10 TaxID=1802598 RepID=A0A1G1WKE0_9BACT|nr:MAG: hypothetical protein A2Z42_02945 [Candidatus Woykebacteria bacterium RBG_19FT_COMBO_43_10]